MAVGIVMVVPDASQEMYDKVMENLGLTADSGDWPEGIISHIAGSSGSDWVVVDVWESRKDFEKFLQERLMGAAQKAGLPAFEPKFFNIYLTHRE